MECGEHVIDEVMCSVACYEHGQVSWQSTDDPGYKLL